MNNINIGLDLFVPYRTKYKFSSSAQQFPPYIKMLLNEKNRLWQQRQTMRGRQSYSSFSKRCKEEIDKYHAHNESKLLKKNRKKFFIYLRNKLRSRQSLPDMKLSTGKRISLDTEKVSGFLNEFKREFSEDNGALPILPDLHINHPINVTLDFSPNNVKKYILSSNKTASPGPDGLPGCFWHSFSSSICYPLSAIFKLSFATGTLPSCWKLSNISPIFKKGDPTLFSNYRPVVLTNIACKVMESIIYDSIMNHLHINSLLSPHQQGFLRNHSTGPQLLECINDWSNAIEHGNCIDVCYINLLKLSILCQFRN
jgi:hypothetical protein